MLLVRYLFFKNIIIIQREIQKILFCFLKRKLNFWHFDQKKINKQKKITKLRRKENNMLTKFICKLSYFRTFNNNVTKLISRNSICGRCPQNSRLTHNWKRQMEWNNEKRKIIPKLVYLHNPWRYLLTKLKLFKFRLLWDREFVESEFIRGSKQVKIMILVNSNFQYRGTSSVCPS